MLSPQSEAQYGTAYIVFYSLQQTRRIDVPQKNGSTRIMSPRNVHIKQIDVLITMQAVQYLPRLLGRNHGIFGNGVAFRMSFHLEHGHNARGDDAVVGCENAVHDAVAHSLEHLPRAYLEFPPFGMAQCLFDFQDDGRVSEFGHADQEGGEVFLEAANVGFQRLGHLRGEVGSYVGWAEGPPFGHAMVLIFLRLFVSQNAIRWGVLLPGCKGECSVDDCPHVFFLVLFALPLFLGSLIGFSGVHF
mmetsp:Transcript_6024/g.13171  ORF Transcript_6024/g.13171 Transcript_6024/m.13171 type:complete len:245 (+) Transcript_6024:221-955(+)